MKKRIVRLLCISLMLLTITGIFSGCYDRRDIDEYAYVLAIGLDKGTTNFLRMTLQIAIPSKIAGGGGSEGGGGEGEKAITITTVETPTIYAGLNMVNIYISRELNMSHAKAIVFSQEIAKEDILTYIHAIKRGREFRGSMHVLVSKCTAEEYIKNVTPKLESNPSRFYEDNQNSFKYTGLTANTSLNDFYLQLESSSRQPVATLSNVNQFEESKDIHANYSTFQGKGREYPLEGDFKAGDLPRSGGVKSEIMGLAVFNGGRMVGELDGQETTHYLMVTGEYEYSYITIPDPQVKDKYIVLNVHQSRKPIHKVVMQGDSPQISVGLRLEADILSIQTGENYESVINVKQLEQTAEAFITDGIQKYLEKTAREFNSDINGFGNILKTKMLTWEQWENQNWLGNYKNSVFHVEVDMKIRRPGLLIRTIPGYSSEGKEMGK